MHNDYLPACPIFFISVRFVSRWRSRSRLWRSRVWKDIMDFSGGDFGPANKSFYRGFSTAKLSALAEPAVRNHGDEHNWIDAQASLLLPRKPPAWTLVVLVSCESSAWTCVLRNGVHGPGTVSHASWRRPWEWARHRRSSCAEPQSVVVSIAKSRCRSKYPRKINMPAQSRLPDSKASAALSARDCRKRMS